MLAERRWPRIVVRGGFPAACAFSTMAKSSNHDAARTDLRRHLNLRLAELGFAPVPVHGEVALDDSLLQYIARNREKDRLLSTYQCPADARLQGFLHEYLEELVVPRLPGRTLVLDRPGMARELSLPPDCDEVVSPLLNSYRLKNGVLHNPKSDRRTTAGIFHVTEDGLPIPDDKKGVPRAVFAALLARALVPPVELHQLPYTARTPEPACTWVSLLLRPVVCPAVPGRSARKTMEIRFFVPGSLVANLDFVERIFGNAGDPYLPENDAGLDVDHWSGHTGCVILAPHLNGLTKREVGLPHWDQATERQRRDGMCWRSEDEKYNDGGAFKLTARDASGVIVTLISDNYFGYCKKEVKTQLSFAANLLGLAEEEHAGGAAVFPRHDLAGDYDASVHREKFPQHTFARAMELLGDAVEVRAEGYALDRRMPGIVYVPELARFELEPLRVRWPAANPLLAESSIPLRVGETYVLPTGFRVHLEKPEGNRAWRLIGTRAEGTLCHKPCTVSGGGKSEISKPITDAIIYGPVFVADFRRDFDAVDLILHRDFSDRFRDPERNGRDRRPILSPQRTLGSVIKLLMPREEYTDDYNGWVTDIPPHIRELVLVVKRFRKASWGPDWRSHFSVDVVNGLPANELRLGRKKLQTQFLRVGYQADGAWRTFGLRKDFQPAAKLQAEDDITASTIVPASWQPVPDPQAPAGSVKLLENAETHLFQRPDDAVVRGYDQAAEADFARADNFFSNYEPLGRNRAFDLLDDAIGFHQFTPPMQELVRSVATDSSVGYFVCTAFPRQVEGKPSKNPRYLQRRPDLVDGVGRYLSEVGLRLSRQMRADQPIFQPVHAVLAGRRNNPAEPGVRSLACYGPIHFMELPELFMEFISSMTGKSPSTTGAGSEGALTKGPFNALPPVYDLNATLTGYLISGYQAFITSAGCLGPRFRVDHDISLLVPELWCRMKVAERDPVYLQKNGYLERLTDYPHDGRVIPASRLGWRVTPRFVQDFFGRIFNHPQAVLPVEALRPELQDPDQFTDAVENVAATHQRVAEHYFSDGSIQDAIPPLRALLHVMRDGHWGGHGLDSPELRGLFDPRQAMDSDWYRARLKAKQAVEVARYRRFTEYVGRFLGRPAYTGESSRLALAERLATARLAWRQAEAESFPDSLRGTIGAEPALSVARTR